MRKKGFRVLLPIFLLLLVASTGFAQDTTAVSFSLQQAQEYAAKNNQDIKNAVLDLMKADKKIWETTAIGLPQVSGKIDYTFIPEAKYLNFGGAEIPVTQKHSGAYTFSANQLIFSGEYIVGLRASKIYRKLSEQGLAKSQEDTKETVTETYYLVLVAEENKRILDSTLLNVVKMASDMTQMNKQGFVDETDADQMKVTELSLRNTISSVDRQVKLAKMMLALQVGMPVDKKVILTDQLQNIISSVNIDALIADKFDLNSSISYQMAETQDQLMKLSYDREKTTILPTVSGFASYKTKFNAPAIDFEPKFMMGLSVNIPIFASGSRYVKIQQAQMEWEKAKNTKDKAAQGISLEANKAKSDLKSAKEKFDKEKENLALTEKIYNRSQFKYKQGVISSLDLTTAYNQYLTAQSTYFTAIQDLLTSQSKLKKILSKN